MVGRRRIMRDWVFYPSFIELIYSPIFCCTLITFPLSPFFLSFILLSFGISSKCNCGVFPLFKLTQVNKETRVPAFIRFI